MKLVAWRLNLRFTARLNRPALASPSKKSVNFSNDFVPPQFPPKFSLCQSNITMAYIAKRKAASESESASKSKSKKPKVVADGSVPAISGKTGPAHKPLKKSAAKPVSKPQIQEVHSDDEDDGFDGFTSDEEDGGVAIDSPAEENGHTSAKQNASSATSMAHVVSFCCLC